MQLFFSAVKPIEKLIAVPCEVLYRNLVERAVDAALEQAESVLNRVGVDFAPCIALIVIDDAMLAKSARRDYFVCRMRVCLQDCVRVDVLRNDRLDYFALGIGDRDQAQSPAALNHAQHD